MNKNVEYIYIIYTSFYHVVFSGAYNLDPGPVKLRPDPKHCLGLALSKLNAYPNPGYIRIRMKMSMSKSISKSSSKVMILIFDGNSKHGAHA